MIPAVPGPQNHALNRLPSIAGWRQGQGVLCFWGTGLLCNLAAAERRNCYAKDLCTGYQCADPIP